MMTAPIRYLALGDSYTIGENVPPDQCWPNQLVGMLRSQGVDISNPLIIAQTGWTTGDLLNAISEEGFVRTFDLVSLLVGVNNQYQSQSLTGYQYEFRLLLEQAAGFAGGSPSHVVVLSIPDWGVTPFADGRDRDQIRTAIQAHNEVNFSETTLVGARYVDITPISRRVGSEPALLVEDNLHPSGKMYAEWVTLVYPVAYEILQSRKKIF